MVLTDPSGANRAYASEDVTFARYDGDRSVEDAIGHGLGDGRARAHRRRAGVCSAASQRSGAFWFGWYAAFPNTRLVR